MKEFIKGIIKIVLFPVYFVIMIPIVLISFSQIMGGAKETMQDKIFKKLGVK